MERVLNALPAAANNIDFGVFRMDFGFHVFPAADGECGRPIKAGLCTQQSRRASRQSGRGAYLLHCMNWTVPQGPIPSAFG